MIEPTDEMAEAGWVALPISAQEPGDYCDVAGPDGLRCRRIPGHQSFSDGPDLHGAYTAAGELVLW